MSETNRRVRILLDAMGGDFAPVEIVKGAVLAAQKHDIEITLIGPKALINAELVKYNGHYPHLHCVDANGFIKEGDSESVALTAQSRPDASIAVAAKMLRAGEADAVLSAGPTAALAGSAIRYLGMIDGIERPVIGGSLSTFAPTTVMMDCGVNVDCKPYHLLTFAVMGCIYAKKFLGIANPSVALLNIGAE
jgi:glycerol-3-phosphate acyltransferase PlsX